MARPSLNDLNYGHLGDATYNIENASWSFSRSPGQGNRLQRIGPWKEVVGPTTQYQGTLPSRTGRLRNIRQTTQAIAREHPELLPSSELLSDLAIPSAAIISTLNVYDPAIGSRLSFGRSAPERHRDHARTVAAIPSGDAGNILRLVVVAKAKHGWESDKSIWLQGQVMIEAESAYWAEDAAPIQQLCFAQSEDRNTFLAARFPTKTVFFRPTHHGRTQPAPRNRFTELPASLFNTGMIFSIHIDQSFGIPHADVTFNPGYQKQFGLIDQRGNWGVWDIEGGYRGGSHFATCTVLGSISLGREDVDSQEATAATPREDGWARILWVGDVNTILVCDRRTVNVVDISGGQATLLQCPELIPMRSPHWILDVKKHPENRNQFFVLTSNRLHLLGVTCKSEVLGTNREPGATIFLSWTHFRGSEDFTLGLSIFNRSAEGTMVFLYSHLNTLITIYRFQNNEQDGPLPFSSSDPAALNLGDELLNSEYYSRHIINLHLDQLQFDEDERYEVYQSGPGREYRSRNILFYNLTVMLSDMSVHQALLYSITPHEEAMQTTVVAPPHWTKTVYPRFGTREAQGDDGFIVPDGLNALSTPRLRVQLRSAKSLENDHLQNDTICDRLWTVDFGFVYDTLRSTSAQLENATDRGVSVVDIMEVLNTVKAFLAIGSDRDDLPQGTIFDIANAAVQVSDIDEASSNLENLCNLDGPSQAVQLRRIVSGQALGLTTGVDPCPTISALYDSILQNWIAPLPNEVPGRIRQLKERFARRIASEVMLSSVRIRPVAQIGNAETVADSHIPAEQGHPTSLPILPSQKAIQESGTDDPSSSQSAPWSSQVTLPSSSQLRPASSTLGPAPSMNSGTTSTSTLSAITSTLSRLSQHVQITRPPPSITPTVTQILMHWQEGVDPNTYDWEATTRAVEEELDEEDEEISAARKAKLQRKAERHLQRQNREMALMRKKAESQPAFGRAGVSRSSPAPVVATGLGPSSPVQNQNQESVGFVVQSQVETGRHGGRPMKKKVKSRMSGF